jgi:hypothetical protein
MEAPELEGGEGHMEARHVSHYLVLKNAPTNRSFSGRIRSQPTGIVRFPCFLMLVSRY